MGGIGGIGAMGGMGGIGAEGAEGGTGGCGWETKGPAETKNSEEHCTSEQSDSPSFPFLSLFSPPPPPLLSSHSIYLLVSQRTDQYSDHVVPYL